MKKHGISLRDSNQFSDFFLDYIEGKESLKPFYTHLPNISAFGDAIKSKNFPQSNREVLVDALNHQYDGLETTEAVSTNIASLGEGNTFTVTTGHQLNLFTGPLYFIYKIVSTINLARKLKEVYPENNFVPVYWMASEDHDFDEINYFKLDGNKYQWNSDQTGAVGEFELDASFKEFLKDVSFSAEVFLEAYRGSKTLAEAVLKYVDGLFNEYGLVVLDANTRDLKREFSAVMKEDVFGHTPFEKATANTEQLEALGYKGQIFPREINFFYLDQGCRERIERSGDRYVVLNTDISFSETEMKEVINETPEKLSPNVVLRPLYQETILPNLGYLGGPAEVVYWLQLKGVFDFFKTPFPVLLPRNFGLLLDPLCRKKIKELDWEVKDIFQDFTSWKKNYVKEQANEDINMEKERLALSEIYEGAAIQASELDPTLNDAFQAGKVRSLKIIDQMCRKLRKAEERRHKVTFDRLDAISEKIRPGGSPQERVVNMMQFYLAKPELIESLIESFDPLDFKMWVFEVE